MREEDYGIMCSPSSSEGASDPQGLTPLELAPACAELLPCPFCGGDADISQIGNDFTKSRGFEVKCLTWGCGTAKRAMVIRHTLDQAREWAVAAWNMRAPDTSPQPVNETPKTERVAGDE